MTAAVLDALRVLQRRGAGVPDRHADNSAVAYAARLLRGQR